MISQLIIHNKHITALPEVSLHRHLEQDVSRQCLLPTQVQNWTLQHSHWKVTHTQQLPFSTAFCKINFPWFHEILQVFHLFITFLNAYIFVQLHFVQIYI